MKFFFGTRQKNLAICAGMCYHQSVNEKRKGVTCVKEGIHPKYQMAKVRCACGTEFETKSTKKELRVDICSNCHPFFTGKQKLVDTGGRVDRFKKRFGIDQK